MADRFFLTRFKNAQDLGVYEKASQEVCNGKKMSHWMWFIFPQIIGFGHSNNTFYYSIKSKEEAIAYLEDPILGPRLREISKTLLELSTSNPAEIFGFPNWLKLGSSMTLFDYISPNDVFDKVLKKYFSESHDLKSISFMRNISSKGKL